MLFAARESVDTAQLNANQGFPKKTSKRDTKEAALTSEMTQKGKTISGALLQLQVCTAGAPYLFTRIRVAAWLACTAPHLHLQTCRMQVSVCCALLMLWCTLLCSGKTYAPTACAARPRTCTRDTAEAHGAYSTSRTTPVVWGGTSVVIRRLPVRYRKVRPQPGQQQQQHRLPSPAEETADMPPFPRQGDEGAGQG